LAQGGSCIRCGRTLCTVSTPISRGICCPAHHIQTRPSAPTLCWGRPAHPAPHALAAAGRPPRAAGHRQDAWLGTGCRSIRKIKPLPASPPPGSSAVSEAQPAGCSGPDTLRAVSWATIRHREDVSELWISYPVYISKWNSIPCTIASADDYPSLALSLLPRHRYWVFLTIPPKR